MINSKSILRNAFAAVALTAVTVPSFAAGSISVASFGDNLAATGTAATFDGSTLYVTSSSTPGLNVTINDGVSGDKVATFNLGPLTKTSAALPNTDGTTSEFLSGGNFSFVSGGNNLLSGHVVSTLFNGQAGNSTLGLKSAGSTVTFDSGSYLGELGLAPGTNGSFAFSLSGVDSGTPGSPIVGPTFVGGSYNPFVANGFSGTFSALTPSVLPTPEPGTIASLGFGAMGLLGLAFKSRRRNA